ncbi:MAG: DUF1587 domain-containing protein, partial [Planctomycetota bacterium]
MRLRFTIKTVFITVLVLAIHGQANADDSQRENLFRTQLQPLLQTYCFDCHGAEDGEGEVSLGAYQSAQALAADRQEWVRALRQVQLGTMPPEDASPMDQATRKRMADLIDELANAVDCMRYPNPGKVVLRRLNKLEYRNTIRDLTLVDYKPAMGFPGDDVGYGFDNIGDVMSLPPLLMEKYLTAAEEIMGQAISTPPPAGIYQSGRTPDKLIGAEEYTYNNGGLGMSHNGTVKFPLVLPFGGKFQLTVTASGNRDGGQPAKMQIRIGKTKRTIDVGNE